MILEKAIFINRAPFERLELDFKEKGVNVLTAINGKGKTTIISHIVDALYELAHKGYQNEFEGKENKYYRVSTSLYNLDFEKPSFVYFRFYEDGKYNDYIDIRNDCSESEYNEAISLVDKIPFRDIEVTLKKSKNIKYWQLQDENLSTIFERNVLTYFPAYRYEEPYFLNDPYTIKVKYKKNSSFAGHLPNSIEVVSDITELSNWIMDLVLDIRSNQHTLLYPNGKGGLIKQVVNSMENEVWNNLNTILSNALNSKHYQGGIRFGIGERNSGATRISIINDNKVICPSVFNLSSGELAILTLFGEILRQADNYQTNIPMRDITGIVLIDEVDKHLHISLQKEILPKMFKLFPNVQFIVSSHSPFLNMGLADELPDDNQIIDLDNGGLISSATTNSQYQEVYEMMLGEKQKYADMYKSVKTELDSIKKPIVITEGKTDIMHILKAKEKLGITDLDFETIDKSKQPDGDGNLLKLLKQLSIVSNPHKIIGVFDCDNIQNNKDIKEIASNPFKDYGNNVYAFCIKAPQFREKEGHNEISIEMLYSDDEIHMPTDVSGRHLFLGNEFSEITGKGIKNKNLLLKNQSERGIFKIVESTDGQAVFDENDTNILSTKNCFAEAISNEFIKISNESWNNFQHIFNTLRTIIND